MKVAWRECEQFCSAISKNNETKRKISRRLRNNSRQAEKFKADLDGKVPPKSAAFMVFVGLLVCVCGLLDTDRFKLITLCHTDWLDVSCGSGENVAMFVCSDNGERGRRIDRYTRRKQRKEGDKNVLCHLSATNNVTAKCSFTKLASSFDFVSIPDADNGRGQESIDEAAVPHRQARAGQHGA